MVYRYTIAWALLFLTGFVRAESYAPDIQEFSASNDLDFPAHSAFALNEQATLEMWVAAGWQSDPGYDPVLLYHADAESLLYVLAMLGDQTGLTLQVGETVDELPFSFSDGRLHHVALINLTDHVVLMIDGQIVGRFNLQIPPKSGDTFRLGSAPGLNTAFTGAIGGLRIWNVAVQRQSLITYALQDIFRSAEPHPDLDSLAAYSDLHNNTINLMAADEEIQ